VITTNSPLASVLSEKFSNFTRGIIKARPFHRIRKYFCGEKNDLALLCTVSDVQSGNSLLEKTASTVHAVVDDYKVNFHNKNRFSYL
jgi:hypothetical protein